MVRVVIMYTADSSHLDAALPELQGIVQTVLREEPDCLGITIHQDVDDPVRFLLFESWTSKAAFTGEHMKTPHIQAFMKRAAAVFTGPPVVTFWQDA